MTVYFLSDWWYWYNIGALQVLGLEPLTISFQVQQLITKLQLSCNCVQSILDFAQHCGVCVCVCVRNV